MRASRKNSFTLMGMALLGFFVLACQFVSLQTTTSETEAAPALQMSYCGADPQEICVLSFGRATDENLFVSIFVPDKNFPSFYLKIDRLAGESLYECEKNPEAPTHVYCIGPLLNLQEAVELKLLAQTDDQLLATGSFVVKAILISESPALGAGEIIVTPEEQVEPTSTADEASETPVTATAETPEANPSYPNPTYP